MGSVKGLENWEERELRQEVKDNRYSELHYYVRKMQGGNSCIKNYNSHIFLAFFKNEQMLVENWKTINNFVAVRIQSKVELLIEKSNFYICCFVETKIDTEIRRMIEADSFCAKKYIFSSNEKDLDTCCAEIEHKIFSIDMKPHNEVTVKLEDIELQNFRAYEGKININFLDKRNKAASFAVIYAKNGVGKTSLMDGVEYALKGEVSRLYALKGKITGPVYRNAARENEESYVKLELDNGKRVTRKVVKVKQGGNDIYRNPPTEGNDIVGDREQWSQILLPHHKIDSFISAKSPRDQYREWVDCTKALENEREEFVRAHGRIRRLNKEITEIENVKNSLIQKLEQLKSDRAEAENFKKLLREYNEISENRKLDCIEFDFEPKEYDRILNQAFNYKKSINEKDIPDLQVKISISKEILEMGEENCQEKIRNLEENKKILDEFEKKIVKKQKSIELEMKKETIGRRLEDIKEKLVPIKNIEDYGTQKVVSAVTVYRRAQQTIKASEKLIRFYTEKEEETELLKTEKILCLEKLERDIITNDKKCSILKRGEEFQDNDIKIKKKELMVLKIERQIEELVEKEKLIKKEIQDIEKIKLSKDVEDFKLEDFREHHIIWKYKIEEKEIDSLIDLVRMYLNYAEQLEEYKRQIQEREVNANELEQLQLAGLKYVCKHSDTNACPVCNTVFEDWKALLKRIQYGERKNDTFLEHQMSKIIELIDETKEKYILIRERCKEQQNQKIQALLKEHDELVKQVIDKRENLDIDKKEIIKLQKQNDCIREELKKEGITFGTSIEEDIQQCLEAKEEEIKRKIEKNKEFLTEYDKKLEFLLGLKKEEKKKQEKAHRELSGIMLDKKLCENVHFILQQGENYNLAVHKKSLDEQFEELEKQQEKLKEELEVYEDVIYIDINELIEKKIYAEAIYKESEKWLKRCRIFPIFTKEKIQTLLEEWEQKYRLRKKQIEILEQIGIENGARNYYKNYAECKKEESRLARQHNQKERLLDEAEKDFADKKEILERKLSDYFNQSSINEIYRKIDPHDIMKNIKYNLSFDEKDEPQLFIQVNDPDKDEAYRPEWYFSTAQLNTVAFSSFFSRAISAVNLPINTILVDDPIGHFDDMNILGFADLMRSILEKSDCQIIISTHDEKVFRILERKLDAEYYSSCFIRLPYAKSETRELLQ